MEKSNRYVLWTLMLTIVIELMGFGLIFPLLPSLFMPGSTTIVSSQASIGLRHFYYGLSMAAWPIGAFFGTPYLGELSDKFGRKRILMICLFMNGLSYAISAISIHFVWLWVFFFGRLLSGFFGGSYDIAQAATADISLPHQKARNMGWITFAVAMGLILGPLITSFTASSSVISWFTISTPFWVAFCLAMLNVIGVQFLFHETYQIKEKARISFFHVFKAFSFVFTDKRVRKLGLIFLLLVIGWGFYIQAIPLILNQYFHFDVQFTGLFFGVLGVGFAAAVLFFQPWVLKYFSLKNIYMVTVLIIGLFLLSAILFPNIKNEWVTVFWIGLFEILCYSSLLAMLSNAVTIHEQGKIMGGAGAVASIAFIINGFSIAWLSDIQVLLPLLVAAIAYLVSGLLMLSFHQ